MPDLLERERSSVPPPELPHARISVVEYRRMLAAGVLEQGNRIQLLDGWLVPDMTRGPIHDDLLIFLDELLRSACPADLQVRNQLAITLATSEPEPDLAVARRTDRAARRAGHPGGSDVVLVVEIADSCPSVDRQLKARLYAEAAIPIYWLVSVPEEAVIVMTDPDPLAGRYQRVMEARGANRLMLPWRSEPVTTVHELLDN